MLAGAWLYPLEAPADSFRCGSKVARTGDTIEELRQRCGDPVRRAASQEVIWLPQGASRVRVEKWYYQPGARRLGRVVWLYREQVVRIETADR